MTINAPRHRQRLCLCHHWHRRNFSVAGFTGNFLAYMHGMIEIDEIRHLVDTLPWNRLTGFHALSHGRERLTRQPLVAVAVDTLLSSWDSRVGCALGSCMTIEAVYPETVNMHAVIEWYGLCNKPSLSPWHTASVPTPWQSSAPQ